MSLDIMIIYPFLSTHSLLVLIIKLTQCIHCDDMRDKRQSSCSSALSYILLTSSVHIFIQIPSIVNVNVYIVSISDLVPESSVLVSMMKFSYRQTEPNQPSL